ncbi:hypothetical protein PR202_ga16862 [Eleusine coracana subsp. coracana]|uniref:Uncharacterized protein n=1 Tax=Eleusine coracana subsp. coracana TaxID=191504 RepID=A0AAV5CNC7_ELECO|nr:hypothetical protein PR202_ga16862 [Eleusine coracana subsp. coracana]
MNASSTMSKESASSYDMAEFDQSAIFLYLDGHDQASIQEQRRMLSKPSFPFATLKYNSCIQTLNIFPSQPMHAAEPIPGKGGNMGMATAMLANGNHSSPKRSEQGGQRSLVVPSPPGPSAPAQKENRIGVTIAKKEATSGGKGVGSSDQERVKDPKVRVS